jgi:hypothetical protein
MQTEVFLIASRNSKISINVFLRGSASSCSKLIGQTHVRPSQTHAARQHLQIYNASMGTIVSGLFMFGAG